MPPDPRDEDPAEQVRRPDVAAVDLLTKQLRARRLP
jgi:hypothetical protein